MKHTDWLSFLDEGAVKWFNDTFDYESEEGKIYSKLYQLTAPEIRSQHPIFHVGKNWDFESTLDTIFNGDYILQKITNIYPNAQALSP